MAWTAPRTWVTGELVTAAQLNEQVRDNTDFLHNRPRARVYRSAGQTFTSGAPGGVVFDAVGYVTTGWVLGGGLLAVPVDGVYLVTAVVTFAANTTGIRAGNIGVYSTGGAFDHYEGGNIVPANPLASTTTALTLVTTVDLTANQQVGATVVQNSGGNLNVIAGANDTYLAATWMGAA